MGKGKRANVYLEVIRKRRGHIFFEWNKCLWVTISVIVYPPFFFTGKLFTWWFFIVVLVYLDLFLIYIEYLKLLTIENTVLIFQFYKYIIVCVFENYWIMKYWFPAYISVNIRLTCGNRLRYFLSPCYQSILNDTEETLQF